MGDPTDYEDVALSQVLGLSLSSKNENHAALVFLSGLAEELKSEGTPAKLNGLTVERALMERLSNPQPETQQWPVHYLLGCYARASELREREPSLRKSLDLLIQLTVSYTALVLFLDMFPQPEEARKRGMLQLLDALEAHQSSAGYDFGPPTSGQARPGVPVAMPAGFLDDLCAHLQSQEQEENWLVLLGVLSRELIERASKLSILGAFQPVVQLASSFICSGKAVMGTLSKLREWGVLEGSGVNSGRRLESGSLLGALFAISGVPDIFNQRTTQRRPDIVEECFPPDGESRPAEIRAAVLSLQTASGYLHSALHTLVMSLLRNPESREATMSWLTLALTLNNERAKMHPDPTLASSDGFMINLCAVLLRMCEPFMGPNCQKAWPRLDPKYVSDPAARAGLALDETRLAATEPEVASWVASWKNPPGGAEEESKTGVLGPSGQPAKPIGQYHFITDVFFMTARCLGIGYTKSIDNLKSFSRRLQSYEDAIADLETQLRRFPHHPLIQGRLRQYQHITRQIKGSDGAYQAALLDPTVIANVMAYYRLLTAFVLRIADPRVAAGAPYTLPLPEQPSMEFRQLPEAWIENLTEVLALAAHTRGRVVQPAAVEDFILFITICLSSPQYIKNPYLRGQLVMVLHEFMPPPEGSTPRGLGSSRAQMSGAQAETAALFQAHPLVIQNMVKSLIHLYVDIEMTDRHNTFYEKFTVRYQIGEIMAYLWQLPQHHAAWRAVATSNAYTYVRFINMMINDSQFLLQEALETLPRVQEIENQMADEAAWAARLPAERAELEEQLSGDHGRLKGDFYLASVCISTMLYTAEDEVVGAVFFSQQVRDRQARILNFFLKYLTVPGERKKLKVKDPESLHWDPKRLVLELGRLHVSLYRRNRQGWVEANVADTDYLGNCPSILTYLMGVLHHLGTMPSDELSDLQSLASEIDEARRAAAEEEAALEDVPSEYEDPLMGTLMRDPVKIPSGNIVDRATIMQQLLTDRRDPFSRAPMTEEDVVPVPELQAEIQAWLAEQRSKRKQEEAVMDQ